MLKTKRIIFTLLYDSGEFCLSRNFRLQRIGDLDWLERNYNFKSVAAHIDELIILNVSRSMNFDREQFLHAVSSLARQTFTPLAVGGFGQEMRMVSQLFGAGADKLVVNSALFDNQLLIEEIVDRYGRQSLVGSLDVGLLEDLQPAIFIKKGQERLEMESVGLALQFAAKNIGEVLIRSKDRDGTSQGLDLRLIDMYSKNFSDIPLILAGGVGHAEHLVEGLRETEVSAVATANLLNFIGSGLKDAREFCRTRGIPLADWASRFD